MTPRALAEETIPLLNPLSCQPIAAAGYYQGLGSVRKIGMLPETQRYVANVMALRSRFGG
jgi:hypothetical protein